VSVTNSNKLSVEESKYRGVSVTKKPLFREVLEGARDFKASEVLQRLPKSSKDLPSKGEPLLILF
jgi:hypothetical protein